MYEELLIGLRGHAKRQGCDDRCPCYDAQDRGYATCSEELAEKAADAIEELSKPRWVPADKPPDDDRNVFIVHGGENLRTVCIGHYDADLKIWYEDRNWFAKPLYWAMLWCEIPPLPEPPMAENQDNN